MTIHFITALIDLNENRTAEMYDTMFRQFVQLLECDINILLFISPIFNNLIDKYNLHRFNKLKILYFDMQHSIFYKIYESFLNNKSEKDNTVKLPEYRNMGKDTIKYMLLMNTKTQFMNMGINYLNDLNNNFDSYAWIDFRIIYIINDYERFKNYLHKLDNHKFTNKYIHIAGCYEKGQLIDNILNTVNWRFCGGFFLGDKESLINMYNVSVNAFYNFLHTYHTMIWEVNYWALLEYNGYLTFNWYKGDHNNSIIEVPIS